MKHPLKNLGKFAHKAKATKPVKTKVGSVTRVASSIKRLSKG
jgi:hypothetical protein